ncbi:hypothetical protein BOTBODRAFT_295302 [Botryobasidium botryosum FD-172 SS1]|uniref:Uncharacterized protein n=1 Tax=Botryobasidium botryosum (strain FD-172 SS1) TaxID=930990 RepID=A0A067MUA7_BOTB1|nr:hypothetical protein BOTBODRAFT_295302 [Botryobasidium botryosum FD-172 SS1]
MSLCAHVCRHTPQYAGYYNYNYSFLTSLVAASFWSILWANLGVSKKRGWKLDETTYKPLYPYRYATFSHHYHLRHRHAQVTACITSGLPSGPLDTSL